MLEQPALLELPKYEPEQGALGERLAIAQKKVRSGTASLSSQTPPNLQ